MDVKSNIAGNVPTIDIIICFVSAVFSIYSANITSFITTTIKTFTGNKPNPELIELKRKVKQLKDELSNISPTGQYAAYVKKERQFNKASDELKTLEDSLSTTANNMKIEGVVRVLINLVALFLIRYSAYVPPFFCTPDNIYWPFNFILRFPAIFGSSTCSNGYTDVSGYALFFLSINLFNSIRKRVHKQKNE